jgi:hypothetical protein
MTLLVKVVQLSVGAVGAILSILNGLIAEVLIFPVESVERP